MIGKLILSFFIVLFAFSIFVRLLKRFLALLLVCAMFFSMTADYEVLAGGGDWESGDTDYAPISSGDSGWRTYGFKAYLYAVGGNKRPNDDEVEKGKFIGQFLWRDSDGDPAKMSSPSQWSLVPRMQDDIDAAVGSYIKTIKPASSSTQITV